MKAEKVYFNLRFFDEGGSEGGGNGDKGGTGGNQSFTYEQLDEIANSRAERAKKSALTNYFKAQGMTEEQAAEAFKQYKDSNSKKNDVSAITAERDKAVQELADLRNKDTLRSLKVSDEYMDFVTFKVSSMVTDKKSFEDCAKEFLKDNKKYTAQGSYRISGGSEASGSGSGTGSNQSINDAIRAAAGRK